MDASIVAQIDARRKRIALAIAARMHMRPNTSHVYYHDDGRHSIGVTFAQDRPPVCSSSMCHGQTAECIHIQASFHGRFYVGEAIHQGERQLLHCGGTSLSDVVSGNGDCVP